MEPEIVDLTQEEQDEQAEEYTDALEMNTSVLEEAESIPNIIRQRERIAALQKEHAGYLKAGVAVNIVPFEWLDNFFNAETPKLGPINLNDIQSDNGIFCDPNHHPLAPVIPAIFDQLVAWYGLAPNCRPVATVIVENNGLLEPEYRRPIFQLHHLVTEAPQHTAYAQIPSFTLSQYNTCQDLIQQCIQLLDAMEHLSQKPGFAESKFRVWVVHDDNIHQLHYQVQPARFVGLGMNILIKPEHFTMTLQEVGLRLGHLVIEQKQTVEHGGKFIRFWPANYHVHFPPTPSDGLVGLQNLGNTCYMNSALQCLVHIPELTHYFLFNCHQQELNEDNPLGMDGKVAKAFANLIHTLFDKKGTPLKYCTPRDFKQVIGHYNNMFSGYHQQDSQEFLAFLLDGLHEDLNRIVKKPITKALEFNEKNADAEKILGLADLSWKNHKLRNDSVIIDLFVGLYKSTLECPNCGKISITFDPFNDLTLPLPVENFWTGTIDLLLEDGPLRSFEVELPKNATYNKLKSYISSKLGLNPAHLFTAEIWNHQFYRNLEDSESRSGYLPISDLISGGDKMVMYEVKHNEGDLIVPVLNTVNPPSNIPDAFGIPFFIALNEKERQSFGAIRQKLEHRYEQLSTFRYFSKVRENQSGRAFIAKDFPLMKGEINDGYESDVSLANPEISGDYAFIVKLFDSSKEVRSRRRNIGHYRPPVSTNDEKVWTPNTNNNFTNLPALLDSLSETKKEFYTYAKKLDIDETQDSAELISPDEASPASATPESHKERDELAGPENTSNESLPESTPEPNLAPLTQDDSDQSPDAHVDADGDSQVADGPVSTDLVQYRTALICEWDPDHFDTFFSGLEEEGEGGKETWSEPEPFVNEGAEELKRQRAEKKDHTLTLDECLQLFSKPEVLGEHDLWYCSRCKEHRQATKQIQIWSTPDILTIHLKRFENQRSFSDKIDAVVDFPIEGLDMSAYLDSPRVDKTGVIYDLFAVDNHYGGIGGGHYTAYVKNFVDNKWYYYDDSRVRDTTPEKAITGAAYLLFYRKRSDSFLGGSSLSSMLEKAREEYDNNEKAQMADLENVYNQTVVEEEDGEEESDEGEPEPETCSEGQVESSCSAGSVGAAPSTKISEDLESGSEENVSSIAVGTDDEEDLSNSRRKQRLLRRGGVKSQPPIDSPAVGSPGSTVSDDDCSTYSSAVIVPSTLNMGALNSPRP